MGGVPENFNFVFLHFYSNSVHFPLESYFFFVAGWKASNGGNDGHELRKPSETIAPTVSAW